MALPSDLTLITVTGTYLTVTGAALTGQVNFSLTTPVQDATGKVILNAFTQPVPLNSNGSISIVLPCTDNANFSPANPSYLVTEQIPGLGRAYYIQLPHTLGATADLSQLAPVTAPPVNTAFGTANTWTATQDYSGNPALKITTGAAAGDILTSDAAGNATWQPAAANGITPPAGDIGGTATAPAVVSTHLSAALPLAQGGTGQATQQAALDALAGATTTGDYLRGNGTHVAMSAVQAADLPAATTTTQGALVLDGTAADIQAPGTQAAGTSGKAADAKHVHPYQPWQFLPETYGAKGDGKIGTGGTGAAGTSTFTDAGASWTAGDAGKLIVINQGTSGAGTVNGTNQNPFCGTISAVNSATSVTLSANLAAPCASAPYIYGTDDAAAINSALTAAAAWAESSAGNWQAQVLFGPKNYMLGAVTQTTSPYKYNCHIPVPIGTQTGRKLVIDLIGAGNAAANMYWENEVPDIQGTCLVSAVFATNQPDVTFGQQSVIGGPAGGNGLTPGNFANTLLTMDGITIVAPWNSQQYGGYGDYLTQMRLGTASYLAFAPVNTPGALIGGPYLSGGNLVSNGVSTGFSFPRWLNNNYCYAEDVTVEGAAFGVQVAEHVYAGKITTMYCGTGISVANITGNLHGSVIGYLSVEQCNWCIQVPNPSANSTYPIFVGLMDQELTNTGHINDPTNVLNGVIYWANLNSSFPAVTGGQNLAVINVFTNGPGPWAGAPAAPASGTAQQNTAYRYATIYASAVTSITSVAVGPASGTLTTITVTAGANQAVPVRVPPGSWWKAAYTGTLTTTWVLD